MSMASPMSSRATPRDLCGAAACALRRIHEMSPRATLGRHDKGGEETLGRHDKEGEGTLGRHDKGGSIVILSGPPPMSSRATPRDLCGVAALA